MYLLLITSKPMNTYNEDGTYNESYLKRIEKRGSR